MHRQPSAVLPLARRRSLYGLQYTSHEVSWLGSPRATDKSVVFYFKMLQMCIGTQVHYLGRSSDFTKLELSERYSALQKNLKK